MRKRARTDGNHKEILQGIRRLRQDLKVGIDCVDTSMLGGGFGDIVVGYSGFNFIFEIKMTRDGKLTPDEIEFFNTWSGQIVKIWSIASMLAYIAAAFEDMHRFEQHKEMMDIYQKWKALI